MPYYRSRRGRRYSRNYGSEAARRHIREAEELSSLLGGTDRKVKEYFFNLSVSKLDSVLSEYGRIYGEDKEEYARLTFPKWKTGRVTMSGMVAERLYKLLPPSMPLQDKYDIAEELWNHVGPKSSKILRFGETASYSEITRMIETYITTLVQAYQIPDNLQRRFIWLSANDVSVQTKILNHLRNLEKERVITAANKQAGLMLEHLGKEVSRYTQHFTTTVNVGNHHLQLTADNEAEGCVLEDYTENSGVRRNGDSNLGIWIFWAIVACVVMFFIFKDRLLAIF